MKKKTLSELLKKVETARIAENQGITNLNDQLIKQMVKGGYVTENGTCIGGSNSSCNNLSCPDSRNGSCSNGLCLV